MRLEVEAMPLNEGSMSAADNLKTILSFFDANRLLDKIEEFRSLDLRTITDSELSKAIFNVLCIEFENAKMLLNFHSTRIIPKGTDLFRIRRIDADDVEIPLKCMRKKADAWNPPKKVITKMGRLNKVGESLLYVSLNPYTAIKELKIKEGEKISLIAYKTKRDIYAVFIGLTNHDSYALTPEEKVKARLIENFLYEEFSRDVGEGTEFLYRASEHIARNYFEPDPADEDEVWMYPSIVSKKEHNLCFRSNVAKRLLRLRGVMIGSFEQGNIICNHITHGIDGNHNFIYYPVGSDVQKSIFPEIITT